MTAEEYIENATSTQEMLATMVRELSSTKVPEFSSEPMTIEDVSNLTGIPETSVRAGILYGWLPIGVAVYNGQVKGPCKGRVSFIILPKKVVGSNRTYMERKKHMKRDLILSIIIGALTTYLPFWEWSNTFTQISGTVVIAMLVFYFLVGTEKDSVKR